MNKATIELQRMPRHWYNYGLMGPPFSQESQTTLDALLAWSQKPENEGRRVYRHLLRAEQERVGDDGLAYDSKADKWADRSDANAPSLSYDIPYCDRVYYLDIYWQ